MSTTILPSFSFKINASMLIFQGVKRDGRFIFFKARPNDSKKSSEQSLVKCWVKGLAVRPP